MSTSVETEISQPNGYYSIINPPCIRANSTFNVVVSVHNAKDTAKIKLQLSGPNFEQEQIVEIQPMSKKTLEFQIPNISTGDYKLNAEGLAGLLFKESANLRYVEFKPNAFVQTDKATYKPNDLVQFRIIFLNNDLLPAVIEETIVVYIKDAAGNRLKQYNNIKPIKGVFSDKLQLSEFPMLGDWSIEVCVNDCAVKTKTFEVAKYVLPKFEVTVETDNKIAVCEETLGVAIKSNYTFGKYVKGKATVVIESYKSSDDSQLNSHVIEKTIDLNGKAYVEFNMTEVLPDGLLNNDYLTLNVLVTMEEELTGATQSAKTEIQVQNDFYSINAPLLNFKKESRNTKINYNVTITNLKGEPICDDKQPVLLSQYRHEIENAEPLKAFLNQYGIATFELPTAEYANAYVKIEYREQIASVHIFTSRKHVEGPSDLVGVHIINENESIKLDADLTILLNTEETLKYFIYTIVSRNNIIESEFVILPQESKTYSFTVHVTAAMIPTSYVYIYYIDGNNFVYHKNSFDVTKEFLNKISLTAPEETQPGDEIALQISTDANSYVGIMGIDQSVVLLKTGNDFDGTEILRTLDNYQIADKTRYGRFADPLMITTNASYSRPDIGNSYREKKIVKRCIKKKRYCKWEEGEEIEEAPPRVRKDFLECWFFDDLESSTGSDIVLKKIVPDTITSWIITGFSLNPTTGFALTAQPTVVQTFRPFFLSTHLPYSIKRGEIVTIPIVLFNYMEEELNAEIIFDNSDEEFEFIDDIKEQNNRIKQLTISSNNGETINFSIRPKHIGHITLKITAKSPLASDAIHKQLKVEAEGITIYKNCDYYISLDENNATQQSTTTSLEIPKDIVEDSTHIEVSVMGDILSSTLTNLDNLVRMPNGCGEQNMVNFVPNILVLGYLESINQVKPDIERKAMNFLQIGYQRELNYRHDDGSYSAFGKSDKAGCTWLTAYVMRAFHQAAKYINIDSHIMLTGLDFLVSKQSANGSFAEHGRLVDYSHCNEVGLTAFVLWALLENVEHVAKYSTVIEKAKQYLEEQSQLTNDLYSLSIALYALQLSKSHVAKELLTKLQMSATQIEGDQKYWNSSKIRGNPIPCGHNVETTAYILLSLLDMNEIVLPIAKWLIAQRNSNGGFISTQDTVVGLQALINFAKKSRVGSTNLEIEFSNSASGGDLKQFTVNKENSMFLQTWQLNKQERELKFNSKGLGTAIVQIAYRYNILDKESKPSFVLGAKVKPCDIPVKLLIDVCAEYVPQAANANDISNMVVMEITLPSGYIAVQEAFKNIKAIEGVKLIETKNDNTIIIVYFESLKKMELKTVPIEAELTHQVAELKPAPVIIYDYYNSQLRATDFYQLTAA